MTRTNLRAATLALAATASLALAPVPAMAQSEQQRLVNQADTTLSNFLRDPEMTWLQQNIGRARAVLIAPEIVKAGFIFGGSGGRAVLVAKEGAKWNGRSFYTMATASVGFQGVAASENVTLLMTQKGMDSMLAANFKVGGDASVAAGPVGAGAKSDILADLIAFSRAKGVYGGVNIDGTLVNLSDDWNRAYYGGKSVQPVDILVRGSVHNKAADKLLGDVGRAAGGK